MATFNYQAAIQAGKKPEEIQAFLSQHPELQVENTPQQPQSSLPTEEPVTGYKQTTRTLSSILNMLGLQVLPNIAGGAYEVGRAIRSGQGEKGVYTKETGEAIANPFLSVEDLNRIAKKPVETAARQTAGLATYGLIPTGATTLAKVGTGAIRGASFTAGIPETSPGEIAAGAAGGAVLEPAAAFLGKLLKHPTFKKIGQQTKAAVSEATNQGKTISYNSVKEKAYEDVLSKDPDIKREIDAIWSKYVPPRLTGKVTPSELLDVREIITRKYGNQLFGKAGESVEHLSQNNELKAAEVLRRAVSNKLQESVPEIMEMDKIVQLYNKGPGLIKGDLVAKAQKAVEAFVIAKYGWPLLRSLNILK